MLSGGWDSLEEAPASVQSCHDQWHGCGQKVWKEQQEEKLGKQSVVTEAEEPFQTLTPVGSMAHRFLSISKSQVWHHASENT